MDWYDPTCYASEIQNAKHEKVLVDDVIDQLDHLSAQQKNDFKRMLNEHTKLFDGTLRVYPHRKFHIDLVPGAVPKHFRPYAVPVIHLEAFKKELIHLVKIGVLSPQGASEWASPTFLTRWKNVTRSISCSYSNKLWFLRSNKCAISMFYCYFLIQYLNLPLVSCSNCM